MTRVMPSGSSRGTAAARATAYERLATRHPRAAGKSHALSSTTAEASTHARKARVARVVPSAHRRPCRNLSSNGPMRGASSTNGAIVSTRKRATRLRASSVGRANTVPASETVSAASAATLTACSSVRRASPVSAAPSALAKERNRRPAARPPVPTARMPARPPRPTVRPASVTRCRMPDVLRAPGPAGFGGVGEWSFVVMTLRSSPAGPPPSCQKRGRSVAARQLPATRRTAAWRSQCCVAIEVLRPRVLGGSGMATGGEALSSP